MGGAGRRGPGATEQVRVREEGPACLGEEAGGGGEALLPGRFQPPTPALAPIGGWREESGAQGSWRPRARDQTPPTPGHHGTCLLG